MRIDINEFDLDTLSFVDAVSICSYILKVCESTENCSILARDVAHNWAMKTLHKLFVLTSSEINYIFLHTTVGVVDRNYDIADVFYI